MCVMNALWRNPFFLFGTIAILSFSCLFTFEKSPCLISESLNQAALHGGSCAAEQTFPAPNPLETEQQDLVVSPVIFQRLHTVVLALLVLVILFHSPFFTFWKIFIGPKQGRCDPVWKTFFLPYLFATHGM